MPRNWAHDNRIRASPAEKGRTMMLFVPDRLKNDVAKTIKTEASCTPILNVPLIAEEIRLRNLFFNIAREDIEEMVLNAALQRGCAVEFDSTIKTREPTGSLGCETLDIELTQDRRIA
jgi:hypothetical protein